MSSAAMALTIYTIGHSTRSIEEFVGLLRAHGVERVVDVRTVPRSLHNPQFNREALSRSLHNRRAGRAGRIGYRHMKSLGGLRHPRKDSPNTGWRNASFRGFADYALTADFEAALAKLVAIARERPTAIMCAEAVPWRCHRSVIADALTVRGIEVRHITSRTSAAVHELRDMARVDGTRITYP
jgi:uncharacterized protein (DUF488 family)